MSAQLFGHVQLFVTHGLWPSRFLYPWDSPGNNTDVGCHILLLGIFPTQKLNPCLWCPMHCQVDSLPVSHLGSPLSRVPMLYIGPCWLFVLYIMLCIYINHNLLIYPSLPIPFPFGNHNFVFYVCESVFLCKYVHLYQFFRFHLILSEIFPLISGSIHIAANGIISFFFMINIILYVYHIFIHYSVDGHLSCFHVRYYK